MPFRSNPLANNGYAWRICFEDLFDAFLVFLRAPKQTLKSISALDALGKYLEISKRSLVYTYLFLQVFIFSLQIKQWKIPALVFFLRFLKLLLCFYFLFCFPHCLRFFLSCSSFLSLDSYCTFSFNFENTSLFMPSYLVFTPFNWCPFNGGWIRSTKYFGKTVISVLFDNGNIVS